MDKYDFTWTLVIFKMLPAGYKSSQTARPGSNFSKARFFVQPKPMLMLRM